MGVKLKLLLFCILLASSVYMAGGYAIKGGEIHLVRPESPYIDSSHIPSEYLSNEDLVFYTCIEETDVPVRTSVLCKDDTSFKDIELHQWNKGQNCYIGTYDLSEKQCRNMVIESEYEKEGEVRTISKDLQINRFTSLLDHVSNEQYSDGGWENSTETAGGIWVLSQYRSIFEDEIQLANKWLKLNRNNEMKCWPNDNCDVRSTAKILSYLTLADNNDSLRVMHDGNIYLKKKQNYFEPGDRWNLTIKPFESGTTNCIITYERNHLNKKNFSINKSETQSYSLDANYDENLIVICDQNIYANLTAQDDELAFVYEGDNLTYSMPYPCWPKDDKWGECDPRATLYALTTEIGDKRKKAAYKYIENKREEAAGKEELIDAGEEITNTALYSFVLGNNSVGDYSTDSLVAWLRFKQNNNGSWAGGGYQEMIRPTSFSIMGLMANGFSRNHEVIQDAESWINYQELQLSSEKTSEYNGWNTTEQDALAFTVLKNNARPLLKFSPSLIMVEQADTEVEVYNPTTFPLEDVTYEFSDNLKDKISIKTKREEIPAFSYVKLEFQREKAELSNIHGYLTVLNKGKQIAKVPVMVVNFPSIDIKTQKERLTVFGTSSPMKFDIEKTGHNFDCELQWEEDDISSKEDFKITQGNLKVDISFSEAKRMENTYHGEFTCKAMGEEFKLPFSIDMSRYSSFPFSVDPKRIKINNTGQTKNFTIKNKLDESLELQVDFQRDTKKFDFSSSSVVIDPNDETSIQIYNNAPPEINITHTNTIDVKALGENKKINFRAFIQSEVEAEGGMMFWPALIFILVLFGGGGYAVYYYWEFIKSLFKKGSSVDKVQMRIKKLEQKEKKTAIVNMIHIMRMLDKEDSEVKKRLQEEGFTDEDIEKGFQAEKGEDEEESEQSGQSNSS